MLLEVLKELCKVLEIKPDSVEQRSCISLMEGAACVHTASLDKVILLQCSNALVKMVENASTLC